MIGHAGGLPWHLPEDLAHFRAVTHGAPVIMGRRTWESLPERFRPLPGRANIVITRDASCRSQGAQQASGLGAALVLAAGQGEGPAWVIGGGRLLEAALDDADLLEVTELDLVVDGDTHAPEPGPEWSVVAADPAEGWHTAAEGLRYRFLRYRRA